jgi:hypothetical protein
LEVQVERQESPPTTNSDVVEFECPDKRLKELFDVDLGAALVNSAQFVNPMIDHRANGLQHLYARGAYMLPHLRGRSQVIGYAPRGVRSITPGL